MTVQVYMDVRTHRLGDDLTSPELVLVDPELGAIARARLPDTAPVDVVGRPPMPIRAPALVSGSRQTPPDLLSLLIARAAGIPWLLVCAAATVSMLLFVDVHGGVSERTRVVVTAPPAVGAPTGVGHLRTPPSRPTPRRFAWAPAPDASAYHIEFFRGSALAFFANTTGPELTVPAHWKDGGSTRSLVPGEYRWYVWPVVRGARAATAIVRARLVVT